MPRRFIVILMLLVATTALWGGERRLMVIPEKVELDGVNREHGVLVSVQESDGRVVDVTREASIATSSEGVVSTSAKGNLLATGNGEAVIRVEYQGLKAEVVVRVAGFEMPGVPSFRGDIEPILTKAGCNQGGCHGKLAGQNGFRLSLRGFAPEWDYDWITSEVNGRRINPAFPEESLIVAKATGLVPHEGGTRFRLDSRMARTLIRWISARAPNSPAEERSAERLEILPGDRTMREGESQQLLVRAYEADGKVRDVTWLAQYFANDENLLTVKPNGLVRAKRSGESTVRVHFQGLVGVITFTVPFSQDVGGADFSAEQTVVDAPVFEKLKALRIPPGARADDASFVRRAYLDAIGTLPSEKEVTEFVSDPAADKRVRLAERLVERPEWTDYWSLQFADLLQNRKERDHDVRGVKGVRSFHAWLRGQLNAHRGWDAIAKDVLLAKGDVVENPAVGYYITVVGEKGRVEESELPDSVAQAFLGTRIGCARCHNHPLERYTQDDFYHFAAFFGKVSLKREKPEAGETELLVATREEREAQRQREDALEKYAALLDSSVLANDSAKCEERGKKIEEAARKVSESEKRLQEIRARLPGAFQPRTNQTLEPAPLDRTAITIQAGGDARLNFVEWMMKDPMFAGAMVNRVWKHYFGVGLVEPVDDLRASNPPTNAKLWAVLNKEFVESGYDLRHLQKLILASRVYQLSSETEPGNEVDSRFYSHYYARRLPAEVLMDAIASATGSPQRFEGYPLGVRAIQLPDSGVNSYFLTLFGRSDRVTACACERKGEVTLPQLLHLENGDEIQKQIRSGVLAEWLKDSDNRGVTQRIFLTALGREPREAEWKLVESQLAEDSREAVFGDLFWALLNSKEFAFNH